MESTDELLEMFTANRELIEGIGRDEEASQWLLNEIAPFSKANLGSAIGALHLMPVNMERAVRLHRLAHSCAAYDLVPNQPIMTLNRLRQIANAQQLAGLASLEDPFESPFSEHFGFNDEDFVVLNGPVESETFVLWLLLDAISDSPLIPDDFRAKVMLAVTSLLRISKLVASRAGIAADALGEHGSGRVEVPTSMGDLRILQTAVTFSKSTLPAEGIDTQTIELFTTSPGRSDALKCSPEKCDFSYPFLDVGDDVIVLQPTVITFALIHYIMAEAKNLQLADALTVGFHEAVLKSILRSFADMNIAVVHREKPTKGESRIFSNLRVRIDVDKELPVLVETDTIETWAPGAEWQSELPIERAGPVMLHVMQSLARPFIHFSDYGDGNLLYSLSAADLETISTLEQRDPLAIWYFIHDTADLLKHTTVSGSTLSLFNLYRGAAHSYYLSDEIVPTFIPLGSFGSGELRLQALRIRRQHLLASYSELLPEDIPLLYDSKHLPLELPRTETTANLPTFRPVMDAAVSRVADEVGPEIASRLGLVTGPIARERRGAVLKKAVEYLFERFEAAIAALSPENLVDSLVLRSEALLREVIVHRGSLANRAFHFADHEAFAEELREELASRYRITSTLRFMIEYVSARPPEGTALLSLSRLDEIMALAAQLIDFAGMSDAIHFELAEMSFSCLLSGRIGRQNAPYPAYSAYLEAFGHDEITRIDAVRKRRTPDEDLSSESISAALDAGVTAEFGVGIHVLRRFFQALAGIALRTSHPWMFTGRREELLLKLLEHGFDLATAERLLTRFALEQREHFLVPPTGFRREDSFPWRADRKYSHRYRPLVMRPRDGGVDVVFGARHILSAWRYLVLQLLSNRYPATSIELKSAMGGLTKNGGALFNRNVARLVRERKTLDIMEQVKKLKVEGKTLRPPGDIDILVIDRKRKRLIALECKNIEPAHDPHAHTYELKELLDGDKSIVAKHRARTEWLRSNLKEVLTALKIETSGRWRVDAAIVTSERIPAPYLQRIGMPVVSFQEFRRMIEANSELSFE